MVGARAMALQEKYREEAEELKKEAGKVHGRGQSKVPERGPEPIPDAGDVRDQFGTTIGFSGRTIDRAARVIRDGVPELVDAMDAGAIGGGYGTPSRVRVPRDHTPVSPAATREGRPHEVGRWHHHFLDRQCGGPVRRPDPRSGGMGTVGAG
jgi:hypothetical protein